MLTDNQMKFLKYVYKPKTIKQVLKKFKLKNYTEINDLFDNPVTYFTYSDDKLDNNTKISLTISGRADVDDRHRDLKMVWLKNVCLPIIISFVTTCITMYIVPKLPLLFKWLVHTILKIF